MAQMTEGQHVLKASERKPRNNAKRIGSADPNEVFTVSMRIRRRSDAPALPDPATSSAIGHGEQGYLTREEFATQFGASQADLDTVAQFAGANGQNHAAGAATGARAEQASVKDQVKFDLKHDLSAEKVGKTEVQTDSLAQGSLQPIDTKSASNVVAPQSTAAAELRAAESNPKQEAIQSIIHNAQLLASKGGGEMHMTLKPDHLGEIQLKVAMEGNHVNVQMVTERGEVKKLIEQSVHELRHGLAQHDLSMAKLDVSVGDKTAGGFKQGMPDFSQARDFANQFHQQNAKREMFEDLSNLRGGGRSGMGLMNSAGSAQSRMTLAS